MKHTTRHIVAIMAAIALTTALARTVQSHCQVPCGIYDDQTRLNQMTEHITTIEKAAVQINTLSTGDTKNYNQIVRWVNTKDTHADALAEIITYYFMAQRIKLPTDGDKEAHDDYVKKLTLLHKLLVYAMKSKQSLTPDNIHQLRTTLTQFHAAYLQNTTAPAPKANLHPFNRQPSAPDMINHIPHQQERPITKNNLPQ